jgi:RNA polymerase-interacting CarD/CdnL/TRCF family regulator
MYERAKYFIVSEVAHVKDIDEEKAEKQVEKALETTIQKLGIEE